MCAAQDPNDTYTRLHYRRFVAWPKRIEREWPLLEEVLASGPSKKVLDLGCGTGEHSRALASRGFEVVGIDRSESMLETAREEETPENLRFIHADLGHLDELAALALGREFGGAICLGNTLPHLTEREELERFARGLRRALLPGAALLLQILNYERIFEEGVRHLPLNFREADDGEGEVVFLRLMATRDDGSVVFCPTSLRFRPEDAENPVEVVSSKRVELRGWRRSELDEVFAHAGFEERRALGGYDRRPYDSATSPDLLFIVR